MRRPAFIYQPTALTAQRRGRGKANAVDIIDCLGVTLEEGAHLQNPLFAFVGA